MDLSAILAVDDFPVILHLASAANLSEIGLITQFGADADADPISALCAYFSSPEFALLERDVSEAGMHDFDDRVRRGLDPTITSEQDVTDKLLVRVMCPHCARHHDAQVDPTEGCVGELHTVEVQFEATVENLA